MVGRKREHGASLAGKSMRGVRRLPRLKGGGGVQDRKVGETPSKPPRVQLKGGGDVQARKVGATPARPAWVAEGQSTAASRPARFRAWRGAA
jgi:hypothetical protein